MKRIVMSLGAILALVARADVGAPAGPAVPEGIADARGQLGIFRARGTGVVAVNLATGKVRWSSVEGEWPLYADGSRVAVAAIDPGDPSALRVRFLRLADGERELESPPITLPNGLTIPDPRTLPEGEATRFSVSAWVQPRAHGSGDREPPLQVLWEWSSVPLYGAESAAEPRRASGVAFVDRATGEVALAGAAEVAPAPKAALPEGYRTDSRLVYWKFSAEGGAWGDAPTPFLIGHGMQAALAYEPRGERQLTAIRWRGPEAPVTLDLASGAEYGPVVAVGGRHVAVVENRDGKERMMLYDLARTPADPIAELPPFGPRCRPPFSVVEDRFLCVREREGQAVRGGIAFRREIVAFDHRSGELSWSLELAPRLVRSLPPGSGSR